ncbi:MAG: hypothetical protein L6Q83_11555 [Gammaproteobacteria bacterium]|nr:hypothetical protein [Gammaproteobacteria bacterium]
MACIAQTSPRSGGRNPVGRAGRLAPGGAVAAIGVILFLLAPHASSGSLWQVTPSVETAVTYETNASNTSDSSAEDDAYIVAFSPAARFERSTPRTEVTFSPRLRLRQDYGNDTNDQLDGTDIFLPVVTQLSGQRSRASLNASYTQLPSREADYQVADPNSPLPPGGLGCDVDARGRCRIEETQSNWALAPSFQYSLSPRFLFGTSVGYQAIRYSEAELTGRFNYDYYFGSMSLTRLLTEKHQIGIGLNAARFDADLEGRPVTNTTETTGFSVNYDYALSPTTSLTVAGGLSVSDFTITGRTTVDGLPCFDPDLNQFVLCDTKGDDKNFVGELRFRQEIDDTITTQYSISRSIRPNSDGAETTFDQATAFVTRDLTRRWQVNAGATYTSEKAIGADNIALLRQRFDRDFARLDLGTSWRISRQWVINGRFSHFIDDQSFVNPLGFGDSSRVSRNDVVSVRVTYTGDPIR